MEMNKEVVQVLDVVLVELEGFNIIFLIISLQSDLDCFNEDFIKDFHAISLVKTYFHQILYHPLVIYQAFRFIHFHLYFIILNNVSIIMKTNFHLRRTYHHLPNLNLL